MMPFGTFSPGLESLVALLICEQDEPATNVARKVIQDKPTIAKGVFWYQCIDHMFAYVALDQPEEAIHELGRIRLGHPYMNLMHLNPELDRFRSHPMFVELQEQALPPTLQQLVEIATANPSCLIPDNTRPGELLKQQERLGLGLMRSYMQSSSAR